jgi:hypothetical protein
MDGTTKEMKDEDIKKFIFKILGIRKWVTVSSIKGVDTHYYRNYNSKSHERSVTKVILLQKCEYTDLERGMIIYGAGSLFKDEIISPEKARLHIEGKL